MVKLNLCENLKSICSSKILCSKEIKKEKEMENTLQIDDKIKIDKYEQNAMKAQRMDIDNRQILNQTKFKKLYPSTTFLGLTFLAFLKTNISNYFNPDRNWAKQKLLIRFPIIKMLKNYKKEYILSDLFVGITIGIMHVPQGMAYGLLVGIPPIYGLYTAFVPGLMYVIFGSSNHLSFGPENLISLMVGNAIANLESKYIPPLNFNSTSISNPEETQNYLSYDRDKAKVLIAAANMFWVGIILIIMSIFQFGSVKSYLSEPLINGFLAGSGVHATTSQVKSVFGISLVSYNGAFKIPKTYYNLFSRIEETNVATLITALVCIIIYYIIKKYVNERYKNVLPSPIPIELLIITFGTLISYLANFKEKYNMKIVGKIQSGLPYPEIPPFFLIKEMFFDCFLTALIVFMISYSLADTFSKKNNYRIYTTQEIFAYGTVNVFGSFFSCFTSAASLSRSCVQENIGGNSQFVTFYSSSFLIIIVLFVAPFFEQLPLACLASIIIVALSHLIFKLKDLSFYWKVSKFEFFQFLITYLSVVVLDVALGLGVAIAFYIFTYIFRSTRAYATLLGNIPGTEIYKDINLYQNAWEIDQIKIVRIEQDLHAANFAQFRNSIYNLTNVRPSKLMENSNIKEVPFQFLIIDCSPINFIDTVGVKTLVQLIVDYNNVGIRIYLSECNDAFIQRFYRMKIATDERILNDIMHITIHDSVMLAKGAYQNKFNRPLNMLVRQVV